MKRGLLTAVLIAVLVVGIAGCTYYRVTDPVSGKVYYTEDIENEGSGAIRFKDKVTRREVTLQQSEIIEINKDQYDAAGQTRETEK